MRSPVRAPSCKCTTVPSASQTVVVMDSTYGLGLVSQASVDASTGASLTPGPYRSRWPKLVVTITAKCTTQNITLLCEILTGVAGTSADWEAQGALGTQTVTAGTTLTYEFKPFGADFRIRYTAGGTPPGAVTVRVAGEWGGDYGN